MENNMLRLEFRRDWLEGFVLDHAGLESVEAHVVRLIGAGASRSYKVELSSSSVRSTGQLAEVMREPNSSSRRIEKLEMYYQSAPDAPARPVDHIQITFSARQSDPAMRLHVASSQEDRLAFLSRELESILHGYSRPRSRLAKAFFGTTPGEPTPVWMLLWIMPVAVAIIALQRIQGRIRELTHSVADVLEHSQNPLQSMKSFVDYLFATGELRNRSAMVSFLGLGLTVALFALISYFDPTRAGPTDRHFLINEYVQAYRKTRILRSQLLWTVVVGVAVSAAGSAVIWYLTK